MNEQTKEHISAFLDNELHGGEAGRMLDRVEQSDELRQTWDRYNLIGDILRGEGVRISTAGIADQVRERIEQEPPILAPAAARRRVQFGESWLRPAAGAAIAASVAVVTLLAWPTLEPAPSGEADGRMAAVPVSPPAPVQLAAAPKPIDGLENGTRWRNLKEREMESKLNRFLVDHNEYAASGSLAGMMPYATFVSYDSGRP